MEPAADAEWLSDVSSCSASSSDDVRAKEEAALARARLVGAAGLKHLPSTLVIRERERESERERERARETDREMAN